MYLKISSCFSLTFLIVLFLKEIGTWGSINLVNLGKGANNADVKLYILFLILNSLKKFF